MKIEKRVCLKDIAAAAKASLSTVSAALNNISGVGDKRKEEIRRVAEKMGYQVSQAAKLLKTKRIDDVGLVIADDWKNGFNNYGFYSLFGEFMKISQAQKIHTQLEWFGAYNSSIPPFLFSNGMVGGILFAGKGDAFVEKYLAERLAFPCVRILEEGKFSVRFDIYDGMLRTMQYLAALGHRRIVLVNGAMKCDVFQQTERAYRRAVSDYLLDGDELLYMEQNMSRPFHEEVERLCKQIARIGADAVIGVGGMLSNALTSRLTILGMKVPENISVMAFATLDSETDFSLPPVTSMCADYPGLVENALQMLKTLMNGGVVSSPQILIPLELKIKQSVEHKKKRILT